jgi:iron-sulfur cluster assembly protein
MEEQAMISVSAAAVGKLQAVMSEKGLDGTHALRVFLAGSGCSGPQYGMAFDRNPRADDVAFLQHGLRVLVDPRSLPYLEGASIDFVDSPEGGAFQIDNPNAVSGCSGGGCRGCG